MKGQELLRDLTDKSMRNFARIPEEDLPDGWICSIRTALGMSLRELGDIANITPQGIKDIESREKTGRITVTALKQIGKHLNLKLVYGFAPLEGSLKRMTGGPAQTLSGKSAATRRKIQGVRSAGERKTSGNIPQETRQKRSDFCWEED